MAPPTKVYSMPTRDDPPAARDFFVLVIDDLAHWPTDLPFGSRRFSLLLILDGRDVGADEFRAWDTFAERAIEQGLAYFCTWGPECERVHDIMDEVNVMRAVDGLGDSFLMTTWHEDSLDEAVEFFKYDAIDKRLQDPLTAPALIALVGRPDLGPEVERALESAVR